MVTDDASIRRTRVATAPVHTTRAVIVNTEELTTPSTSVPVPARHTEVTRMNYYASPRPFSSHGRNADLLQPAPHHLTAVSINIPMRSPACNFRVVDRSRVISAGLGALSSDGQNTTAPTPAPSECDIHSASAHFNVGFAVGPMINSHRGDNARCTIQTEAVIHHRGNAVSPSSVIHDGNNLQVQIQRQDPISEAGSSHLYDDEHIASYPEYKTTGYYNNREKHVNFPEIYDCDDEGRDTFCSGEDPVNRLAYLLANSLQNNTSMSDQNNSVLINRMSYAKSLRRFCGDPLNWKIYIYFLCDDNKKTYLTDANRNTGLSFTCQNHAHLLFYIQENFK